MNRFENKLCPVCRSRFIEKADIVVCPICGTPHHRSCYEIKGKCGLEEYHESGFTWNGRLPDEPEPSAAHQTSPYESAAPTEPSAPQTGQDAHRDNIFAEMGEDYGFNTFFNSLGDSALGEDGVSMRELISYAATSAFHYGRAFQTFRTKIEGRKRKVFFNFASGFFAPIFQFYRKMDIVGLIATVLVLAPVLFAAFFPEFVLTGFASLLLNAINLGTLIVFSAFGDYFYYQHAVKRIIRFRESYDGNTQSDEYFEALSQEGKPSALRAVIGFLAVMLLASLIMLWSGKNGNPLMFI